MSDLAQLKEQVDATINLADERRYFGASVKYQQALEAEVEQLTEHIKERERVWSERERVALKEAKRLEAEVERLTADLATARSATYVQRLGAEVDRAHREIERLKAELKFGHGFDGTIHSTYTMRLEDRGPDVRVIKFGWAVTQQLLNDAEPGALVAHVSMQFRDQLEELLRRAAGERHGDRASPTWGEERSP